MVLARKEFFVSTIPAVKIFDTTLRDGAQTEGISFSVDDKLKIAQRLDKLGIHYLEAGWPGSNPKDLVFFEKVKTLNLRIKVTAFGCTRYKNIKPTDDINLRSILDAGVSVACIFGKTWDMHVTDALQTTFDENCNMIADSVVFLKEHGLEVIYDAEHFFDGYKANPEYALTTIAAAQKAGADCITLCDTNGGLFPHEVPAVMDEVKKIIRIPLGIHTHNDGGMADANSIMAVVHGATLVQGTINGYGERCGNANLCTLIPSLQLKMKRMNDIHIEDLTEVSYFVSDVANRVPDPTQPYVGYAAFAHKAGIHASAIARNTKTYEHMEPSLVGNERRILVSELSGKSNILSRRKELHLDGASEESIKKILDVIKDKEHEGFHYESADASLELLIKKSMGAFTPSFDLGGFTVIVEKDSDGTMRSEAVIKIVADGQEEHAAASGDGPVNALDNALRKALERFFPLLQEVSLSDFKVRVISGEGGTASKVRVLIESRDASAEWTTIGVSENIIEASWQALVDAIEYKLLKG